MNMGMIKTIAKTGLTIVNIAVTIYQVKQITETIKQNIDKNIEEQVREATGEKDFDLAEYRKTKEMKSEKFLKNVKVNIDIDGLRIDFEINEIARIVGRLNHLVVGHHHGFVKVRMTHITVIHKEILIG